MRTTDFFKIFEVLAKYNVEYIIVGGVSAVLNGAPVTTYDLDIIHSREKDNLGRLMSALTELNTYYRTRRDIKIVPEVDALSSPGHHLLVTDFGPLDILGTVGNGLDYNDIFKESNTMKAGEFHVRVQNLESLIFVKKEIGRDKDHLTLPILQETLQKKQNKDK